MMKRTLRILLTIVTLTIFVTCTLINAIASEMELEGYKLSFIKFRDARIFTRPRDIKGSNLWADKQARAWAESSPENMAKAEDILRLFGRLAVYEFSPAEGDKKFDSLIISYRTYNVVKSFKDLYKEIDDIPAPVTPEEVSEKEINAFIGHMLKDMPKEEKKKLTKEEMDSIREFAVSEVLAPSDVLVTNEYRTFLRGKDPDNPYMAIVTEGGKAYFTNLVRNGLSSLQLKKYKHSFRHEARLEVNLTEFQLAKVPIEEESVEDITIRMFSVTSIYVNEGGLGPMAYIPEVNKIE